MQRQSIRSGLVLVLVHFLTLAGCHSPGGLESDRSSSADGGLGRSEEALASGFDEEIEECLGNCEDIYSECMETMEWEVRELGGDRRSLTLGCFDDRNACAAVCDRDTRPEFDPGRLLPSDRVEQPRIRLEVSPTIYGSRPSPLPGFVDPNACRDSCNAKHQKCLDDNRDARERGGRTANCSWWLGVCLDACGYPPISH